MRALDTAATGMAAMDLQVQVIAGNIANMTHHRLQEPARRVPGPDLRARAAHRRAGVRPGQHPAGRHRARLRRQNRRHAAADDPGHAGADRQYARRRHPGRRLVQDPDARRHLQLYPRRLVPDGCAGPHRHRRRQRGAADHHHPAELERADHQSAGPGFGDAAGQHDVDHARPVHADDASSTMPACRPTATTCSPPRRLPARRRTACRRPTAPARCCKAASNNPTSRRSPKSPT